MLRPASWCRAEEEEEGGNWCVCVVGASRGKEPRPETALGAGKGSRQGVGTGEPSQSSHYRKGGEKTGRKGHLEGRCLCHLPPGTLSAGREQGLSLVPA